MGPVAPAFAQGPTPSKWERGRGWGWVWGDTDEVGNLNELGPALTTKALGLGTSRVYDLGMTYDRRTFKSPVTPRARSSPTATPQGLLKPGGVPTGPTNTSQSAYASCINSISDNVATQIDGFGHFFAGPEQAGRPPTW